MKIDNERLVSGRKLRGMSLQDVSNELAKLGIKITKQGLNKYEKGVTEPNSDMMDALCKIFNLRPEYFYKMPRMKIEFGEWHINTGKYYK